MMTYRDTKEMGERVMLMQYASYRGQWDNYNPLGESKLPSEKKRAELRKKRKKRKRR